MPVFKPVVTIGLWFMGLVFAVFNAIVAAVAVQPWAGEYANHVFKTIVAVAFMLFLGWLHALVTRGPRAYSAAWATGFIWLVLTIAFEFLAGHYAFGNSWERLIADYRIWEGRLWPLVLAALLVGPAIFAALLRALGRQRDQPGAAADR
jgi:hypothetical protein